MRKSSREVENRVGRLRQIVAMVEDAKPDAVVVAGDIYDRAVPPADAVELLDSVLTELVDRLATPTVLIAGNGPNAFNPAPGRRTCEPPRPAPTNLDSESQAPWAAVCGSRSRGRKALKTTCR